MNEKQARRYFNREARYYGAGLPPDRTDIYAIRLPQGGQDGLEVVAAPDTAILWRRFWEKVQG